MSNMSYCRFQNTSSDLTDCVEDLELRESSEPEDEDGDPIEPLSDREARAAFLLIVKCQSIVEMVCESTGIDYDNLRDEDIKAYISELQAAAAIAQAAREDEEAAKEEQADKIERRAE